MLALRAMPNATAQAAAADLARTAQAVDWVAAACISCLLYDYTITLGQEIGRIWPSRMSLAKCLYFANRYVVSAMLVSVHALR
ncbi:hypothetical protein FIBSPDRAFT_951681 [Athelia psychrophila]|uniref:DUF6533 domain-containing protein n=1 Tax=Athelia psychrophila TaxID=1759441 RepID=A0A166M9I9_9AGAM|nr:hypothetical protein FIBSPDRAFT_951681 [Fibularhizoctonia sp. CBS 109695]